MTGEARYLVGIDLGTSNCAMAFAEPGANSNVVDFLIAQLQRPGWSQNNRCFLPASTFRTRTSFRKPHSGCHGELPNRRLSVNVRVGKEPVFRGD
jgi:molecular chaperone DnaK (HSP70)